MENRANSSISTRFQLLISKQPLLLNMCTWAELLPDTGPHKEYRKLVFI